MSDDNKQTYDRREVELDEKNRVLDLSRMNLVAPSVGICDAPLRFYPLNNEWAKIIIGLVSWLATIAPWQGAEDETFPAIQEVETFMVGCSPCEAIVGCFQGIIDTPYEELSDTLKELYELFKKLQAKQGTITYPIVYNDNPVLLPASEECDYGHLFAAATGLIDLADLSIVDLLQKVEAASVALEAVAEVISAIPGLGVLPLDEIFALVDQFLDMTLTNYLAAYTQPLRDQYRCDLFCLAQDSCGFFFVEAFDYFADRAVVDIETMDMQDFVEFLSGGVFTGEEYVHVLHAFFFFCLAFGFSFVGVDAEYLAKVVQAKFNDTDPDWEILCECVWDTLYAYEFEDAKGWNVVYGQWYPAEARLSTVNVPGVRCNQKVERTFSPGLSTLTEVWCNGVDIQYAGTHVGAGVYLSITHGGGTYTDTYLGNPDGQNVEFALPVPLDGVTYISLEVREDLVGDGGYGRSTGVYLFGHGGNPPPPP